MDSGDNADEDSKMAKIEGLQIKNFKVLKDVTLGRLWNQPNSRPLTPMTAVIGKMAWERAPYSMRSDS